MSFLFTKENSVFMWASKIELNWITVVEIAQKLKSDLYMNKMCFSCSVSP